MRLAHFLDAFAHLYKRVRPSVRPSVGHTRVEFLRNGPNLNKIASGMRKYAIQKTIQRQVRGQYARTHLLSEHCSTCFCVFLVACTRLYKSLCRSVGWLVGRSVGQLVCPTLLFFAFLSFLRVEKCRFKYFMSVRQQFGTFIFIFCLIW